MNREELVALRTALDAVLTWPDAVRAEMARWLAVENPKPNGLDRHPPSTAPTLRPAEARRGRSPAAAKAGEQRLIATMRESPGLSVAALARAAASSRSRTGERLRQLAAEGTVEKDAAGRWRIAGADVRPPPPEAEARPPPPPSG